MKIKQMSMLNSSQVFTRARKLGWSDIQLAQVLGTSRESVRRARAGEQEVKFNVGWHCWQIVCEQETPADYDFDKE